MNDVWQIQNAKNKLSEVITRALTQGPQVITKHGEKTVVVVSYAEYKKIILGQSRFSEFFRASPLAGIELDLTRDKGLPREGVEL